MPGKGRGGSKGKGKDVPKKSRGKSKVVEVAARGSSSSSDDEGPPLLSLETATVKRGKTANRPKPAAPEPTQQGKTVTRPEPAALHQDSSSDHEAAVIPVSQSSQPSSQPTESQKQAVILTDEQEEDIVEWLKEHPMLYDKTDKLYR